MAIEDYLPNVFGSSAPTYLQGLLGAEETQKLQGRANVQGLLGAGLALAQGMSRTGPRRSAAENILGALSGGFGAAGGAYDQGIKNYVTQQQIAQTQLAQQDALLKRQQTVAQQGAIEELLKSPEIANDPLKVAYIRANPNEALKMFSEQLPLQQAISGGQVQTAPQAAPQVAADVPAGQERAMPEVTVTATPGPDAMLQQDKNRLIDENRRIAGLTSEQAQKRRKENLEQITAIDKQLDRFAVSGYDFDTVKKSVSDKFKPQIDAIKQLAETQALGADQVRIAIQEVFKQSQESEKGQRIDGLPGEFAQMRFGTMDRTKLAPNQLAEVLRFADAPTADQSAQLSRESQRLQFETGRGSSVPAGRGSFIGSPPQGMVQQPVVSPQAAPQPAPQVVAQAPQSAPSQISPAAPVSQQPARVSTVIDPRVAQNPLISQPDSKVPPKKKQDLLQAQPGLIGASNYTLKNIVDARNAAQSLLDNPTYIDSLSGRMAPLRTQTMGGIVLDQQAYTANEILNNILGRSFISEIQEMRANSPTGGAVGNVAVAEMESLSRIRGAFKVGMEKAELKKQLESYINNANRALKTIPNDYARTYGYNGEFDDLLSSEVVSPQPTTNKLPPGVKVRRKP